MAADRSTPEGKREIVQAVCDRIVAGDRIHQACATQGISWRDLWQWKAVDRDLHALYARAREASGESWEDKSTEEVENATVESVQLSRLREDHYRWRAKMANRQQYADKVEVSPGGNQTWAEVLASAAGLAVTKAAEPSTLDADSAT